MGLLLAVLGLLFLLIGRGVLPRMPGDLTFGKGNVKVFVPLGTSLLLSLVLTLLLNLFTRRCRVIRGSHAIAESLDPRLPSIVEVPAAAGPPFFTKGRRRPVEGAGPEEVHVSGSLTQLIAAASSGGTNSSYGLLLTLVLMGGVFYFLLIRPQQRRVRAQRELMGSLSVGDDVVTIGGIYGTIRELDDEETVLEVADGVEVRFLRSAIARKVSFDDEPYEDEDEDDEREGDEHHPAVEEKEAGDQS